METGTNLDTPNMQQTSVLSQQSVLEALQLNHLRNYLHLHIFIYLSAEQTVLPLTWTWPTAC